jgi:hypothetical protein
MLLQSIAVRMVGLIDKRRNVMNAQVCETEIRALSENEIDAVQGGFIGHAALLVAVTVFSWMLLEEKHGAGGNGGSVGPSVARGIT